MQTQTTRMYLYYQRHRVVILDTTGNYFQRRFQQVYTQNLVAHRGSDNQILIEFVNQDQKRVDLTGLTFTCRLISTDGSTMLLEKALVPVNLTVGQTKLVLTSAELDLIGPGKIGFSVEQDEVSGLTKPIFVDDNAGARGIIDVVDSIMPAFVPSKQLTIPAHVKPSYVTSLLYTNDLNFITFQLNMDQFIGDILVEGALDIDNSWYTIQTEPINVASDIYTFNVTGFHPYIRLSITEISGTITKILYR